MFIRHYFVLLLVYGVFSLRGIHNVAVNRSANDSGVILTCDTECVLPDFPENGQYFLLENDTPPVPETIVQNATVIMYVCRDGYEPVFAPTAVCHNGTWDTEFIHCRKTTKCLLPSAPLNGKYTIPSTTLQSLPGTQIQDWTVLKFSCDPLHELKGQSFIMCRNGAWRGSVPECKRSKMCATPEPPKNGNVIIIGLEETRTPPAGNIVEEYTVLYFTCKTAHYLNGDKLAICLDGRWLGGRPTCEEYNGCTLPEELTNGQYEIFSPTVSAETLVSSEKVSENSILSFSCNTSFRLEGAEMVFCRNKKWSSDFPRCKKSNNCFLPDFPKNGQYEVVGSSVLPIPSHEVKEFSALSFSCVESYNLVGRDVIFCKNERWTADLPRCERDTNCVVPSYLSEHANYHLNDSLAILLAGSTVKEHATLRLSCKFPYRVIGAESATCVNGSWLQEMPKCSEIPAECSSFYKNVSSGVYTIRPTRAQRSFSVYCDVNLAGNKWTVIQSRFNGSVDFYRNYSEYQKGFGSVHGEHWLGLENIYELTRDNQHELYVDLEGFDGTKMYARYSNFTIGNSTTGYKLYIDGFNGTAGDALEWHNGMQFSTFDKDQDIDANNCADMRQGAWWYKTCAMSNLNGHYYTSQVSTDKSFNWYYMYNSYVSIKSSRMLVRKVD